MGMCPSSSWQQSLNSLNKTRSACVRLRVWDWITSVERMWGRTALESAWVMRNGECTACTGTLWTPDSPGSPAPTANPRLGAAGSLSFLKTQTHHKYHQSLRSKWTIYLFFSSFFFTGRDINFYFYRMIDIVTKQRGKPPWDGMRKKLEREPRRLLGDTG